MVKWFSIVFWTLAIIAIGWVSYDRLPPEYNPFIPLSIDHPIGMVTKSGDLPPARKGPEEIRQRKLVRRSHFLTIIAAWIITVPAAAILSAIIFHALTLLR